MYNSIYDIIEALEHVNSVNEYDMLYDDLKEILQNGKFDMDIIQNVIIRGKYSVNKFSDISTTENMLRAKESLVAYLQSIAKKRMNGSMSDTGRKYLEEYLENFYFFLEALREKEPNKKATLNSAKLKQISIDNEYDLQHLLYAAIKPLCMDARLEIVEDTGFGMVRADIKIQSINAVIETKCTRPNMSVKKLTEEVEADIVHYSDDYIYFYIYDKEKIIKDRLIFEKTYSREFDGKHIKCMVLQPMLI